MSYATDLIAIAKSKNISIKDEDINGHKHLSCKCLTCGKEFEKIGYQIKNLEFPCPRCSKHFHYLRSLKKREAKFIKELQDKKPTFKLMGDFHSYYTPATFLHITCNHIIHDVVPHNLLRDPYTNKGCRYCSPSHHWTDDEIIKWLTANTPDYEFISSEMIKHNNYVTLKHKCGKKFPVLWTSFYSMGTRCPLCKGGAKKDLADFKKQVYELEQDHYIVDPKSIYVNAKTPLRMIHVDCGKDYPVTPNGFLSGTRCPFCSQSRGEHIITLILDSLHISYVYQKRFDSCFYKEVLPFDFYLPDYNLCIEYDGIQHYQPVEFFGGEDNFKLTKLRDSIKTDWCKNNDVNLLRVPYIYNTESSIRKFLDENIFHKA